MSVRHTPVLVAGGSLIGLSTSALLARHGVPHLSVESDVGTAIHPRAADSGADAVPAAALVPPDGGLAWKTGGNDDEGARQLLRVMSAILDAKPMGMDA